MRSKASIATSRSSSPNSKPRKAYWARIPPVTAGSLQTTTPNHSLTPIRMQCPAEASQSRGKEKTTPRLARHQIVNDCVLSAVPASSERATRTSIQQRFRWSIRRASARRDTKFCAARPPGIWMHRCSASSHLRSASNYRFGRRHFATPSGNASSSGFGFITATTGFGREGMDQRVLRLGGRLYF